MTWQKRARLVIAVGGTAFAVLVALRFRQATPPADVRVATSDPKAVAESAQGIHFRQNRSHEDVSISYQRLTTYTDGSSKLEGVTVKTERANGRQFVITGRDASVSKNESDLSLSGDVHITVSDGMHIRTERATYSDSDGTVHAPGPVDIARGRLTGSSTGLVYNKTTDQLTLVDNIQLHLAPDDGGAGGLEIAAPANVIFDRVAKAIHFDKGLKAVRGGQHIQADAALAHLSEDEERLEAIELRGNARVTGAEGGVGGLRALSGQSVDLKYAADGQAIQHALIVGTGHIELAGDQGQSGRQIGANTIELSLASDGATPRAISAHDGVQLAFPAEADAPGRVINAQHLEGRGEEGRGLTSAHFEGGVRYREQGPGVDRRAVSQVLDTALGPGLSSIDEARFARDVHFEDSTMAAAAATARYVLGNGTLELAGGGGPTDSVPRVDTTQIGIDATKISVVIDGPMVAASGTVKSVLKRQNDDANGKSGGPNAARMPSMLKKDQDVLVTAAALDYDGTHSKATYTGGVSLSQGDTSIKAPTLVIDSSDGDLAGSGTDDSPVATSMVREEANDEGKVERIRSSGKAKDLKYEDAVRRLTYTGSAHLVGAAGDLTATKIELYLTPEGDEVDRVQAYEKITLRETSGRKTTGNQLTYTARDEQYVIVGTPVDVVEACGRETTGKTLTLFRATDRIVMDGSERGHSQTVHNGTNCL